MEHIREVINCMKGQYGFKNYKEIAEALGVSEGRIKSLANGIVNKFDAKEFAILVKEFNFNPFFLSDGIGNIYTDRDKMTKTDVTAIGSFDVPIDQSNIITAPIISAKASAGNGAIHYDVETVGQLMIDRMMFKILPNLQNIRAVEVSGDSMYPTLKDGDFVIIEDGEQFTGEGIYVLQFDSMLLVKRLQGSSRGIRVLSDNIYYKEDEYIPEDDQRTFQIVGKVILRIQR